MRTRTLLLALMIAFLAAGVPQAHATLYTGSCALDLEFRFSEPIRATGSAPDYTITVTQSIDLDGGWAGNQSCAVTLDALDPVRTTNVTAYGTSSFWSCSAVLASGLWDENWRNQAGTFGPNSVLGTHQLYGAWGAWTMVIENPALNFTGFMPLTLDKSDAASGCLNVTTVHMKGVMLFQDPEGIGI